MASTTLRTLLVLGVVLASTSPHAQAPSPAWTQWGGPTRDFMVSSTGLANTWPASGPKRIWTRPLGEGHSTILFENGRLYTQYRPLGATPARRSQEEVVAALEVEVDEYVARHARPRDLTRA